MGETAPCPPAVARPAGICNLWNYELGCRVRAKACSLLKAGLGMPARTCDVPQAFQPADCFQGPQSLHLSLGDRSSLPHGHVRLRMLPLRIGLLVPCSALHGPRGSFCPPIVPIVCTVFHGSRYAHLCRHPSHSTAHQPTNRITASHRSQLLQTTVAPLEAAAGTAASSDEYGYALSEQQRRSMLLSSVSLSRWGWVSFWAQLALSITSAVILLFSMGFTSAVRCNSFSVQLLQPAACKTCGTNMQIRCTCCGKPPPSAISLG